MTLRRVGVTAALAALAASTLPACTATANVSDVWMSIDEDGARRRGVFFTDSQGITCVAEVGIGRRDVTLDILFRQLSSAPLGTDAFEPMNAVVLAREFHPDVTTDGPSTVALTMAPSSLDEEGRVKEDQEAPYPPGSYVCEVYLDGKLQRSVSFDIAYAPCPTAVILQGSPCLGFYTSSTECPASGATGSPEPTCVCEREGWSCR